MFNRNTVQIVAEQRELPGECLQNADSPDGLRRFRYFTGRLLNGIVFNRQPEAYAYAVINVRLRLTVKQKKSLGCLRYADPACLARLNRMKT